MADEGGFCKFREVLLHVEQTQPNIVEIDCVSSSDVTIKTDGYVKSNAGGGFSYKDTTRIESLERNRFIHWRTSKSVLELSEESLDINLLENVLKIHFHNASLLPNVEIFETSSAILVLAATTNSVHRFVFPHPNRLVRHEFSLSPRTTISTQSIFSDANLPEIYKPWNFATFSHSCTSFSAWLCQDGHCLFSMVTNEGTPFLVKLPPLRRQDAVEQFELKNTGMMQRLWSGLVPSGIRGGSIPSDSVVSIEIHPIAKQTYVFTLCCDYKIRIWSYQTQECVAVKNLVDDIPDDADVQGNTGQTHLLRKSINSVTQTLYLGVFLSLGLHNQFSVYDVVVMDGEVNLVLVTKLFSPKGNLVDFVINTKQIWTLWLTDDGVPVVQYSFIESSQSAPTGWESVLLEKENPSEIPVPHHLDPREAYLDYLFHPGRFSKNTIDKAIKIFDTSTRGSLTTLRKLHMKEEVIALVDAQIQSSAYGSEILHEEFSDLQLQMWSAFYTCVVQYHEVANRPLGLFVDVTTGLVAIIRKEAMSFLRPFDDLEILYRYPVSEGSFTKLAGKTFSIENQTERSDMRNLVTCIQLITKQLSPEHIGLVESELARGNDPSSITQEIASVLLVQADQPTSSEELIREKQFVMEVEMRLQKIQNLLECLETLLDTLDVGTQLTDEEIENIGADTSAQHLNLRRLFASDLSVRILASSLGQESAARMSLCRDLLILMHIVARLSARTELLNVLDYNRLVVLVDNSGGSLGIFNTAGLHSLGSYTVTSSHVPRASYLLRTYFSLHWTSQKPVLPTPPNALESNLKQLAALEISDTTNVETAIVPESITCTVLEMFLSGSGGHQMRLLIPRNIKDVESVIPGSFQTAIHNALHALAQLLWPNRPSVFFPEYLVTKGQFQTLLEYCFVLGSWCVGGEPTRSFLKGQSHLVFGDYFKAFDCFMEAIQQLDYNEPFFNKLLMYESMDRNQRAVQCYIKVMRLFEQFGATEFVLKVANVALSVAENDERSLPIIWSNIFKHELELGHSDEAYAAITSNPDIERKRDCLHRFVVVLCERGQRQKLVEYPYVNLLEEVVNIIVYHARTVDIATHTYYQLLYAFHTFRGDYRKAATSMYEYGMRLAQELPGLQSLQTQAKCYLTTMNSLKLLDPKNAWIVKPMDHRNNKNLEGSNMSPKRKQGDEDGDESYTTMIPKMKRRVTVLEIADLEKEYMLVLARLQLLQKDADPAHATGPTLSPDETLVLLVQAGLYDTAFTIANSFDLPLTSIFDGLAARCVKLSLYSASSTDMRVDERMAWLKANDTGIVGLPTDSSPADQAWHLLKMYLERFASKQNCIYYKCVCTRLLSKGCALPTWLINFYKIANPAELLQLLINYDMLHEATSLALEYLNAVMGHGKEYFGIEETLVVTSSPVWFPYTALDQLVAALGKVEGDEALHQLRDNLHNKIAEYLETVARVSDDMVDTRWKTSRNRDRRGSHDSEHTVMRGY